MGTIAVFGAVTSIVINLLRTIFFVIDGLVYGLAGLFFSFAMEFVNLNDFINLSNVLSRMNQVVYSFLSIVMFFRVGFSLLQWLVDPSKMEDKEGGAKKIVVNIMICLLLIVAVPKVFDVAMDIQDKVIKENIIGEALYGTDGEGIEVSNVGKSLARATWGLFLRPTNNLIDINIFTDEVKLWKKYFDISEGVNDDADALVKLFTKLNAKSVILFGRYEFSYLILISTIAGIYLCWTFIKLAIDFAYRALKMFMLQLLSPIAIISYIDPKSSKNGIFAKWLKETMKTYLSIFTRIACYAIAALLMNEFTRALYGRETSTINAILRDTIGINGDTFIALIYILAIVAFVKNAPKFIDGILGTEISKGSETKFAHDLLRAGFGAIGGAASGAIGGAVVAKAKGLPMGASVAQGLKNGVKQGWANGKKGGFEGAINAGKTMYSGFTGESVRKYFGVPAPEEERKAKDYDEVVNQMKTAVAVGKKAKNAAMPTKEAIISEFNKPGRNINNMAVDFHNLIGDPNAEGAYIAFATSTAETNSIPGLTDKGKQYYEAEGYAKMQAALCKISYEKTAKDKDVKVSAFAGLSIDDKNKEIMDRLEKENKRRDEMHEERYTTWQEMYADIGKKMGMSIDASTITISEAYDVAIDYEIKSKTGHTVDEWKNIYVKAENDAKSASDTVAYYEKTSDGMNDKRIKGLYKTAKGVVEAENYNQEN